MRSSLVILTALSFTFFGASNLGAQVLAVGGGCVAGGGAANAPVAVGGAPQIGNVNFGISFTAPASSAACFALFGLCELTPLPDYVPLPLPCVVPCGRAVMLNPPPILLGNNIPPTPTTFPLPRMRLSSGSAFSP